MKRLKPSLKVSLNAPVVLGFAAICVLALALDFITGKRSTHLLFSVYRSSLLDPLTYVRMIGHVFGHAGWEHFIGNMMLLLVIGPLLEEKYGSKRMILFILTTAVVTGAANMLLFSNVRMLGASGVVFAMILASSFTSVKKGYIPLTFLLVAIIYLGNQVYESVFVRSNTAYLAHILGGVTGAVLAYFYEEDRQSI